MENASREPVLQVSNLSVQFHTRRGTVYAVNDVDIVLHAGETLALVGESGSGKSVSSMALMGLLPQPPASIAPAARALLHGKDLLHLPEKELRQVRGNDISMIFQDPMSSLNPCMRIIDQVAEPLLLHRHISRAQAHELAVRELELTGIPDAPRRALCFPHEFSGGMRQRVMIAMALITRPAVLLADEPTTALDVVVQEQVLSLLQKRQQQLGTAIVLVSHDLGVVRKYAHHVAVMYAGSIIEQAEKDELFSHPVHAYTRALLAARPTPNAKGHPLPSIPGLPAALLSPPCGCSFRERNTLGRPDLCLTDRVPQLVECSPGHLVRDCPGCIG